MWFYLLRNLIWGDNTIKDMYVVTDKWYSRDYMNKFSLLLDSSGNTKIKDTFMFHSTVYTTSVVVKEAEFWSKTLPDRIFVVRSGVSISEKIFLDYNTMAREYKIRGWQPNGDNSFIDLNTGRKHTYEKIKLSDCSKLEENEICNMDCIYVVYDLKKQDTVGITRDIDIARMCKELNSCVIVSVIRRNSDIEVRLNEVRQHITRATYDSDKGYRNIALDKELTYESVAKQKLLD